MDPEAFRELVADVFAVMFPGCTDEWALIRPTNCSVPLCQVVRARGDGTESLPEHVILGTLINMRKRGDGPRRHDAA
jgi:hypothetical protein